MPVYEVAAAGFEAGNPATVERMLWVLAPDSDTVMDAIRDTGAESWSQVSPENYLAMFVDYSLPEQTIALQAELLEWASVERNKNRAC